MEKLRPPDFIGIGVQRGATSWAYTMLRQHPGIHMPRKEFHYFDREHEDNAQNYFRAFADAKEGQVSGEYTPDYISDDRAMREIRRHCPDSKLLVFLREPMERTYSAYQLMRSNNVDRDLSFQEAIKVNTALVEKSIYSPQMERVFSLFPESQVFVCTQDMVINNGAAVVKEMYRFLSIDDGFEPEGVADARNTSALPGLHGLIGIPQLSQALNSPFLRPIKRSAAFKTLKRKLLERHKSTMTLEYPDKTTLERFQEDTIALERLLSIDLSSWKQRQRIALKSIGAV